jgi:hypothetical protein
VTAFLALAAALGLAGVATFTYFGGYWYQYWQQVRETTKAPPRPHWQSEVKSSRPVNFRSSDDD